MVPRWRVPFECPIRSTSVAGALSLAVHSHGHMPRIPTDDRRDTADQANSAHPATSSEHQMGVGRQKKDLRRPTDQSSSITDRQG